MRYVVYEVGSNALIPECKGKFARSYKTETAAKSARTRMLRKLNKGTVLWKPEDLAVAEFNFFFDHIKQPVQQVERVNIMTGKKYMEDVNTPMCCSPSSETYWSM